MKYSEQDPPPLHKCFGKWDPSAKMLSIWKSDLPLRPIMNTNLIYIYISAIFRIYAYWEASNIALSLQIAQISQNFFPWLAYKQISREAAQADQNICSSIYYWMVPKVGLIIFAAYRNGK